MIHQKLQNQFEKIAFEKYAKLFKRLGFDQIRFQFPNQHRAWVKENKNRISQALAFKRLIWNDFQTKSSNHINPFIVEMDFMLPICFSYFGDLKMGNSDIHFNAPACVIIHPFKEHTKLIIATTSENYTKLENLISSLTSKDFAVMMLSSLVYVSDNWLINPDFYLESFPPYLKDIINNATYLPVSRDEAHLHPTAQTLDPKMTGGFRTA